jgi:hypothetical protein
VVGVVVEVLVWVVVEVLVGKALVEVVLVMVGRTNTLATTITVRVITAARIIIIYETLLLFTLEPLKFIVSPHSVNLFL